ncbi:MAG: hypothetical protein ACREX6_08135 [Casimicrobiaceae bacterium]
MSGLLPPLKPIPIKERLSILFIEKGGLDFIDGAFVVVEGARVREMYKQIAKRHGVEWKERDYDPEKWDASDVFRETKLLDRIIPEIEDMLAARDIERPGAPPDAIGPAFANDGPLGDAGHRS